MNDNTNNNAAPKTFDIIDGNTLMAQEYEPLQFAVDKILPHGLFILAGSGKIGKSWLSLDICVAVATGGSLWDFSSEQGTALYLALEDNHRRLQDRLDKFQAGGMDISRLKLTTASFGISGGLLEQANHFLTANPETKLIIVDTLERIRDTEIDRSIYSCDYRDMSLLREITNKHKLTLLLIHHTRKVSDDDPLNMLSGSMGLVGATDGVFVLEKEKRTSNKAKLTIANRDTEGFCFRLEFDPEKCKWMFLGNDADLQPDQQEEKINEKDEWLCLLVDDFLHDTWRGTATELCDALKAIDPESDLTHLRISKQLKTNTTLLKNDYNIAINFERKRDGRVITLTRHAEQTTACDNVTA